MRKTHIMVFLIMTSTLLKAQNYDFKINSREVIVHKEDTVIKANILTGQLKKDPKDNRIYFWYLKSAISTNVGGYSGKLLDGTYQEIVNNKLITNGHFEEGCKTGLWKSWYYSGRIKRISKWNEGLLDGKCILYGENGDIIKSGIYKKGELLTKNQKNGLKNILTRKENGKSLDKNLKKSYKEGFSASEDTTIVRNKKKALTKISK